MKHGNKLAAGAVLVSAIWAGGYVWYRLSDRQSDQVRSESLPEARSNRENTVGLIESLAGIEKESQVGERLARVNSMSDELTEAECQALYDYLRQKENDRDDHAVKNDIMNRLRNQRNPSPALAGVLLEIFYDQEQDIVMRSYALQHLRACYLFQNMRSSEVLQAFYDGLEEYDTEISGVAILALGHLARSLPDEFNSAEVAFQAAELAGNEETNILSRISAVGVCGNLRGEAALPTVRKLAGDDVPMNLKIASIAALGKLGDPGDAELLAEIAGQKIRPHAVAAVAALKMLNERFQ